MKQSHSALREMIAAVAEIADIVRDLDPGKVAAYDRIEKHLVNARLALSSAETFERR